MEKWSLDEKMGHEPNHMQLYVCACICMYVCMYICRYVHGYIFTFSSSLHVCMFAMSLASNLNHQFHMVAMVT